jgi:anti-anti-sigma factor
MHVSVESDNGEAVLLLLEGSVSQRDVALNDPIADALGEDGHARRIAIDMSEVASLDSSGVNWLLVRQKQMRKAGGKLVLHSLSPIAMNVLKVLNLHTVFKLADSQDEAVRLLGDAG